MDKVIVFRFCKRYSSCELFFKKEDGIFVKKFLFSMSILFSWPYLCPGSVDETQEERRNILREVVMRGGIKEIEECVRRLVPIDSNIKPLHYAAGCGYADEAKQLIALGFGVEDKDSDGFTPLQIAALCEHDFVLQVLIAAGADKSSIVNLNISPDLIRYINWYTPEIAEQKNTLFGKVVQKAFREYAKGRPLLLAKILGGATDKDQSVLPPRVVQRARDFIESSDLKNIVIPDLKRDIPGLKI